MGIRRKRLDGRGRRGAPDALGHVPCDYLKHALPANPSGVALLHDRLEAPPPATFSRISRSA
eukprot:363057-Pyramimonas_sp.AAC.1